MVKIAIVIYSTYGHILTVSKAEAEGVKAAGAEVDLYQLPSGEPNDASASAGLPVITPSKLADYDGILFGIPSRYGTHPYAFKAFFDATGAQWASGAYHGKYAGFFVTTGTQGGGQESVIRNSVTILAHHGLIYVPLGYARAFGEITNLSEVHGGSPWGAGSIAGPSGARQPSKLELDVARIQGKSFAETVAKGLGKTLKGVDAYGAAGAAGTTGTSGESKSANQDLNSSNAVDSSSPNGTSAGATDATGAGAPGSTGAGAGAAGAGAGAAGVGAAGVGAAGVAGSGSEASGLQGKSKDLANEASQGPDALKNKAEGITDEAKNAGSEAKSAPGKAEKAAGNEAKETAEKEKEGCCKCM